MQIQSDRDFPELRKQFNFWRQRFPMFKHDVNRIETIVETHIKNHSIALMMHRQTHDKRHLVQAQHELDEINRIVRTVEKIELMSLLSRG